MAGPDDIERLAASLWRFIGGPVLRTGVLIMIAIYVYGVAELQNTFLDSLPPLSRLTDQDVKEFMDMYGLSAVMPFLSIIVFATLIHIVNLVIFSVANVLPPRFFTRDEAAAQRLVDDHFMRGLKSRLVGGRSTYSLNDMVDERLAKLRLDRPDHPDVRWIDVLEQRESSAIAWVATLRFMDSRPLSFQESRCTALMTLPP